MRYIFNFLIVGLFPLLGWGQQTHPFNGIKDYQSDVYALTNAHIIRAPGDTLEKATLLVKHQLIQKVGEDVRIPEHAVVVDLKGKYVYPSFIDLFRHYGLPEPQKIGKRPNKKPQFHSQKKGPYSWNEAIRPEYNAYEHFRVQKKQAKKIRQQGFGTVVAHQKNGIARGSGALVTLGDQRENQVILKKEAAAYYSFDKGKSTQNYPTSLMGAIALLRQTHYDAQWYQKAKSHPQVQTNASLEAWQELQSLPQIFTVDDQLSIFRVHKIAREFGRDFIVKTAGDGYQRLDLVKETGSPYILPLTFPDPPDVKDPYDALEVSFARLKHWEIAPKNPAFYEEEGISFALTGKGLEKTKQFWPRLRKTIKYGLSKETALKALTIEPARLLNVSDRLGTLEEGKLANFLITSGDIFSKKTVIYQNWVQGEPYVLRDHITEDIRGDYQLSIGDGPEMSLSIKGKVHHPKGKIKIDDSTNKKVRFQQRGELLTLVFQKEDEFVRLSGWKEHDTLWKGKAQIGQDRWRQWTATLTDPYAPTDISQQDDSLNLGPVIYPFRAYGRETLSPPPQEHVLFKNATVWTNEEEGVIQNGDVLIEDGRIQEVGKQVDPDGAKVVDASGQYLTCGIVDEHAHIAISGGVNEASEANTAEVRIGDVVNSRDVNIYRQLAGGVTTIHLLHGSANPIGGQNEIIKMRWGQSPEGLKFEEAPPFMKFALGENVKQSNWGDDYTKRFPQTRLGVEQLMYDAFIRARQYKQRWKRYQDMSRREQRDTVPPRKNLTLGTLWEVLQEERYITCHSYVQSEIRMLLNLADSMGFTLNTFTHVLEGYKVADRFKEHGAGASTFSDWWAYKYEVIDAIPHNAALMAKQGVVTAVNSDNAEMGRRLNQEAAKAMKYGNLSLQEAWKLVTLNPAKLLHIEDEVGSIEEGKMADLVLWSENPLSVYAEAQKTYVDGRCYFDRERYQERRQWMEEERHRLIRKILKSDDQKPTKDKLKDEK